LAPKQNSQRQRAKSLSAATLYSVWNGKGRSVFSRPY